MFRNLFGGGHRARGFRPRHDRGGIHFLFPVVVGVVSGELPCRVEGQRFQYVRMTDPGSTARTVVRVENVGWYARTVSYSRCDVS